MRFTSMNGGLFELLPRSSDAERSRLRGAAAGWPAVADAPPLPPLPPLPPVASRPPLLSPVAGRGGDEKRGGKGRFTPRAGVVDFDERADAAEAASGDAPSPWLPGAAQLPVGVVAEPRWDAADAWNVGMWRVASPALVGWRLGGVAGPCASPLATASLAGPRTALSLGAPDTPIVCVVVSAPDRSAAGASVAAATAVPSPGVVSGDVRGSGDAAGCALGDAGSVVVAGLVGLSRAGRLMAGRTRREPKQPTPCQAGKHLCYGARIYRLQTCQHTVVCVSVAAARRYLRG